MIASDVLPRAELEELLSYRSEVCVSLFMPTHRLGVDTEQDPIRLKNLLKDAEDRLVESGMRRTIAKDLLSPAAELLEKVEFWRFQQDGLALFLSTGFFRPFRVPLALHELVVVAERFEIKPLLPLLAGDGHYFILALSQNHNRLLRATRYSLREVETPSVPRSLAEALRYDDPERQLQFHSKSGGPTTQGRRAAVFHGHGVGIDDAKSNLLRYCQQIDRGLHEILREEQAPLVLAAVEYEQSIYREANTYAGLEAQGIAGNPDAVSADDLARAAWEIVAPRFKAAQETAAESFRAAAATGRASSALETVVPASLQGRVDKLFAARGAHVWGRISPETHEVTVSNNGPSPGDVDLLDEAARQTLTKGGTVFVVDPAEMPVASNIAALFRY